jgi:rfaE bifunctional protein nucleotidyltransferase chain/domain
MLSLEQAGAFVTGVRAAGGRVAFTNGVFDVLHPGHVRYLAEARALADVLIVGVNSDRSVRAIKGPNRPVNSEQERAEVLVSLASVDAALVFDEETPYNVIRYLQPDVLVKGADWSTDQIVGRDIVEARGGKVVRIAMVEGMSSTELIRRAGDAASRRVRDASRRVRE